MTQFDHEKLDVYRLAIAFAGFSFGVVRELATVHRHGRDQLLRASQSVPLNIAEGNAKRSPRDRRRFFEIARGSAMESAAALDVLVACGSVEEEDILQGKQQLVRIVSMLTKLCEQQMQMIREDAAAYSVESDYDYEHDYD